MHVRISTSTGASDIDAGIDFVRDQVVPQLQQQKGFRGLSASADRSTGRVHVLTMWETEADLDASESMADKVRADAFKVMGGQPTVERFEQLVWETGTVPPGPGARLHVRRLRMDPDRIEDNLGYFQREVLPDIQSTPGFLGARLLMNRDTGEGSVGTLWADEDSRQAALVRAQQRRPTAEGRGIEFTEDQTAEVLYTMRP